jgi:hypothetical protein
MMKLRRTVSFGVFMKILFFLSFLTLSAACFAQNNVIDGIIFDKTSKDRVAEVNVLNTATGKSVYNNLKGEFKIDAHLGDVLIFTKQDYHADTLKIQSFTSLAVYIKPTTIRLKEVNIRDSALTPEEQLERTKEDYTKIYGHLGDRDLLSVGPGGAGISIDALYNIFSRSGRNAQRLKETIQQDYYQNVIDYRFNRTLVTRITGLKDGQLIDFMQRYRPGYYFVVGASDYDFITYIKANYKRYLRRPKAYQLQPLVAK